MNPYWRSVVPIFIACWFAWTSAAADPARISALVEEGKLDDALAAAEEDLAANSNDVTTRFLRGLILTRMNRLDEAAGAFEELSEAHPELPEPYNNLAVIYAAKGDFERARQALQKAINTHPSYATAHENLGDIYAKMASQAYNQALELNEDNATAKAKLSLINNLFSLPAPAASTQVAAAARPEPRARPEPPAVAPKQEAPAPESRPGPVPPAAPETTPPPQPQAKAETVPAGVAPPAAAAEPAVVDEVRRAVDLWATAWSSKDFAAYAGTYAPDFTPPGGESRAAWERSRRDRIARPAFIKIEVSALQVKILDGDHAQAEFTQNYQSDTFSDSVKKALTLRKSGDRWLITQEDSR